MLRAGAWCVSALLKAVSDSVERRFNPITVTGEITGFSRATSGHCYFFIKDAEGQIRCAMFRRAANLLNFTPHDGLKIELRGRLTVYETRGELQLVVEAMQQTGLGTLFEQFLVLKARLESQGLFEPRRKRSIPLHPKAIGVVTSLGAAALHDVVSVLARRSPHIPVVIYPASVQGSQAPIELNAALLAAATRHEVDVLLLVRGGGAIEDLWAFNGEALARSISSSPVPVIVGVGHETDFTIADFCADLRAPTPTAAAELCAAAQDVLSGVIDLVQARLIEAMARQIEAAGQRLDWVAAKAGRPSMLIAAQQSELTVYAQQFRFGALSVIRDCAADLHVLEDLSAQVHRALSSHMHQLERCEVRLGVLDPRLPLKRGYAWLSDLEGIPLTSVAALHCGQPIRAILADGQVDLTVATPRLI